MFFCCLRTYTLALSYFRSFYAAVCEVATRKYLLSDDYEYDHAMTRVPEDSIYVEEWVRNDDRRRRLLYEGEEITPYEGDPFRPVKTPWVWIGDRETGVDLTEAVGRYLMPGNRITLDLLLRFIRCDSQTNLIYVDPRTMEEVKFPAEGVRIEANDFTQDSVRNR